MAGSLALSPEVTAELAHDVSVGLGTVSLKAVIGPAVAVVKITLSGGVVAWTAGVVATGVATPVPSSVVAPGVSIAPVGDCGAVWLAGSPFVAATVVSDDPTGGWSAGGTITACPPCPITIGLFTRSGCVSIAAANATNSAGGFIMIRFLNFRSAPPSPARMRDRCVRSSIGRRS